MRISLGGLVILVFTGLALLIALPLLGDQNFYSDDLAGHVALVLRMSEVGGDPWFYDRAWFSGFPAFEFYGFLPHWLSAQAAGLFGGGWNGATRAVHAITAGSVLALPVAAWWFVTGWLNSGHERRALLAGGVAVALTLFLTVFEPNTVAGVRHLVMSGVFGQLPGWVLMLAYLGCLGRAVHGSSVQHWISVVLFSFVMAAHPLTAAAGLVAAFVLVERHADWRRAMGHAAALVVTSAWFWVPFMIWSGDYGIGPPRPSDYAVLSILFDGWLDCLSGLSVSAWVLVAELAVAAAILRSLFGAIAGGTAIQQSVVLLLLVGLALDGTAFPEAFSLGVHYDRLVVIFSLLIGLLAMVGAAESLPPVPRYLGHAAPVALLMLCVPILLQSYQSHPWPSTANPDGYADELGFLSQLDSLPPDARLYIEYPRKLPGTRISPGKFAESRAWWASGHEIVNGMLVQSSRPYNLYTTVAEKLGAEAFSMPPLGWHSVSLDRVGLFDLLRRNAVTHVVSVNPSFDRVLRDMPGVRELNHSGRYTIYAVDGALSRLRAISSPVIGYVDVNGTLPFRFLDTFVELRKSVSGRVRLVPMDASEATKASVDGVIINVEAEDVPESLDWRLITVPGNRKLPVLRIHFALQDRSRLLSRTRLPEREAYEQAARYLQGRFERLLRGFADSLETGSKPAGAAADFEWQAQGQRVRFEHLSVGEWYEFAYSHFPAWQMEGADLHRGSAGHWIFYASEPEAAATYSRWSSGPVLGGWLLSVFGLLALGVLQHRWPQFKP